jgi:hypothetical protein
MKDVIRFVDLRKVDIDTQGIVNSLISYDWIFTIFPIVT